MGEEQKRLWIAAEATWSTAETTFCSYDQPLANVGYLNYLVLLLVDIDYAYPEVVANISKAPRKWTQMLQILGWEGADVRTYIELFKVVVQDIILLGS